MKTLVFSLMLACAALTCRAYYTRPIFDSVKLVADSNQTYYQKVVKVAPGISDTSVYIRILEFMAGKNIQQSYADELGRKLIFTTAQDLNNNLVYVGDDNDAVDPYSVQFAVTLDLKPHKYRYTISNVIFYLPTQTGNRRETLNDIYLKATTASSRHVAKDAKKLLDSFERYLSALTGELNFYVNKKQSMYKSTF
jgi:hypothetical protein